MECKTFSESVNYTWDYRYSSYPSAIDLICLTQLFPMESILLQMTYRKEKSFLYSFLIHSFAVEHLGWVHNLSIMNSIVLTSPVQFPLRYLNLETRFH